MNKILILNTGCFGIRLNKFRKYFHESKQARPNKGGLKIIYLGHTEKHWDSLISHVFEAALGCGGVQVGNPTNQFLNNNLTT